MTGKLDQTAKEFCHLVSAYAVAVTSSAIDNLVLSRTVAPAGVLIDEDQKPDITLPLRNKDGVAFGSIELYADPSRPFDEDDHQIAAMFADSSGFSLAHTQEFQSSTGSETQFRQMVEIAREGIWSVDLDEKVTYLNHAIAEMLGYQRSEILGRSIFEFLSADEVEVSRKIFEAELIGKLGPREVMLKRADGSYVWTQVSGSNINNDDGERIGSLGIMVDISERKRAEEALQSKQRALETALDVNRNLIDSTLDVVCVTDDEGRFVSVNRRARDVWGYEPDDMIGQNFRSYLAPDTITPPREKIREFRANRIGKAPFEVKMRHKDGHYVEMSLTLSWNEKHQLMFSYLRDLTEQKVLEERLQQAQRLEAISQLTGGVAHDFNNLLTVILGNSETLANRLSNDQQSRMLAEMTRTAAERGSDLTNRLLSFARQQALDPKPCDVADLLTRMEGLIRRVMDGNIEIVCEGKDGLQDVLVDSSQLETAILNIAVNARDAMPDGGSLIISTANVTLDASNTELGSETKPGAFVEIVFRDTGCGMSAESLSRAFEPFYTTKPVGDGSGLGLSMVYGFIRQSRGHVTVTSEPGEGTAVRLYLPVCEAATEVVAAPAPVIAEDSGNELILLVEDNDLVRTFVEGQLESLGYRVISVENGVKALDVLRDDNSIDLLFTDVVMPGGLNGRQLADEARKLRTGIKVLFTSGYSEDTIIHHGRLDEDVQLLSKPYKRRELAEKVRLALEAGERV
ncbi:MAG: PAS domain S-box protein [Parvibaculum sp.]|nr:PAS domain S-box protein [Parvibaculum sp.]